MRLLFLFLAFVFVALHTNAQTDYASQHANYDSKTLAVEGYDVVSYIKIKKAVKGSKSLEYTYKGIRYRFSNKTNLEAFKQSPEKYLPQYGGWCAYAMGKTGKKVEIDPESFLVTNGKLYLFYDSFFNDTRDKWKKGDTESLRKKADKNWGTTIKSKK